MTLVALVGERGSAAYPLKLLTDIQKHHPELAIVSVADWPAATGAPTEAIVAARQQVQAATGVVIAVSEYQPAAVVALTNALAWLTGEKPLLAAKPVVVMTTSFATLGSTHAQEALCQVLDRHGIKAEVVATVALTACQKLFTADGRLTDDAALHQVANALKQLNQRIEETEDNQVTQPQIAWDATYDVIVIGFGGAGATAARFAADHGAKVLLVDSAPEGHEGGNTRYAGQIVGSASDFDQMKAYYQRLQYPLALDEEMVDTYVDGMVKMSDYFKQYLGVEKPFSVRRDWHHDKPNLAEMLPEYPEYAGGQSYDVLLVHDGTFDSAFWKTLRQQVVARSSQIDVWFSSPARHLLQDPQTKTIIGAQIERENVVQNIQAKNGVVLATGGFENNKQMIQDYLGAESLQPLGSVYNKGAGVLMAQEVGADLWHMHNYESLGLTVREPEGQRGKILFGWTAMASGAAFAIGDDGTRYMNECEANRHGHLYDHGTWRIPANNVHPYLVTDAAKHDALIAENPEWTAKFKKAPTLADLAAIIGVPATKLTQTRERFDRFAQAGEDPAFDRDPATMTALGDGPYYALPLRQSMLNTQGGPRRNVRCEVLDPTGTPIPHLYSAGELGGISANQYQGGNNLAECLIFGKIAGMNAARVKDFPSTTSTAKSATDAVSGASQQPMHSDLKPEPATYPTGEHQYIGRSTAGMGNEIVVRVTYAEHKLEDVEVLQQNESGDFGLKAIKQLPAKMVAANSTDVDAVSGASVSSNALKEAVASAIAKAEATEQ
ncbi:FAD-dependent oxidoreductase [Lacticaseibacillus sp. GG6-2]